MQVETKILAFDDFSGLFAQADAMVSPARLHGVLVGLICVGQKLDGKFWLDATLRMVEARAVLPSKQRDLIIHLYDVTCRQLCDLDSELQLLLPNNSQFLIDSAMALSQWCEGFLYGLGLDDGSAYDNIPEDIREGLRCISELAKLDFEKIEMAAESTEMEKMAYQGVVEYVRSAVMSFYRGMQHKTNCLH